MNNIESSTGEIVMYQPDETIRLEVNNNLQLNTTQNATADRTVLVYLAGKNNLSKSLQMNLEQMKAGSRYIGSNTLLTFVRRDVQGAPYEKIMSALFEKNTFCSSIIDIYHRTQNGEDIMQLEWYQAVGW